MTVNNRDSQGITGEFINSAYPYVTSSNFPDGPAVEHDRGFKISFLEITNKGSSGTLFLGFTQAGVEGSQKISMKPDETRILPLMADSVWVSASVNNLAYELVLGVTRLGQAQLPDWSGSL